MIGLANYGLTFTVDAPYLLKEGVDVDDFPVLVKIPIANTTNLYDTGETADTIYFESEGETLKHELIEINATYAIAWVKMDLEAATKKVVTLHYGALVDNNYEDKRGVWVNGVNIYHFNGNCLDTMGVNNGTPGAGCLYGYEYGEHYQGIYIPAASSITVTSTILTMPYTVILVYSNLNSAESHDIEYIGTDRIDYFGGSTNASFVRFYTGGTSNYLALGDSPNFQTQQGMYAFKKILTGNNLSVYLNGNTQTITATSGTVADKFTYDEFGYDFTYNSKARFTLAEMLIFNDGKSDYFICAFARMYNNPDAYIEYGMEVDLDDLTALDIDEADCVANVTKQLGIYDVDFRNIMYEIGDFNATWRLPGTEGITIWGIYQPRPVGDYYFPEMDNLGINDALFFTVTDYLVDIHDKIDIEGVRFDLQAIQVHPIADQKIYKMCVLKRQPEYYATCTGTVS